MEGYMLEIGCQISLFIEARVGFTVLVAEASPPLPLLSLAYLNGNLPRL